MRDSWINVDLGHILVQSKEKHKPQKEEEHFYIGLEHIEKGIGELCGLNRFEKIKTVKNKFSKGQILYGKLRPYLNKVYLAKESGVCSTDILVFQPKKEVLPKFALQYMLSRQFVNDMSANTNGVNLPRVPTSFINNYLFPLPPLPEQRAIVAKIEQLFSELDNGIANLKTAKEKLKIYRQAVLKKAFEGELTNSINRMKIIPFGEEIKIVSGNTPKGLNDISSSGNIPFYKVSDMNLPGNQIEMKCSKLVLNDNDIKKLKIKIHPKGTVIFPKRGGAILTNKKRILSKDAAFDLNLMGVIPNENYISKYLFYFFQLQDLGKICDGSAVPQINNKNISPLNLPKYSLKEQNQIVEEIETRLSVCDNVLSTIEANLEKSESLRQSILKRAFEGELLDEKELEACRKEADWEPAEKLLERINKEKT